jgi:hypothetical protein
MKKMLAKTMTEIMTSQKFSLLIEQLVLDKKCSYMDAILLYCEKNEMEIESAAKLVNIKIKQQLEIEYGELNFLPKAAALPI